MYKCISDINSNIIIVPHIWHVNIHHILYFNFGDEKNNYFLIFFHEAYYNHSYIVILLYSSYILYSTIHPITSRVNEQ